MCGVRNQDSFVLPFHYAQHSSSSFHLLWKLFVLFPSCQCSSQKEVGKAEEKVALLAKDISKKLHSVVSYLCCFDQRTTLSCNGVWEM